MRLFTAFENKSSILFVKLLVLFFHTMYCKCLYSRMGNTSGIEELFYVSHPEFREQ